MREVVDRRSSAEDQPIDPKILETCEYLGDIARSLARLARDNRLSLLDSIFSIAAKTAREMLRGAAATSPRDGSPTTLH